MNRPPQAAPARSRTVCPACRQVIETGGVRCPHCYADLQRLEPLPSGQVAERIREHDRHVAEQRRPLVTARNVFFLLVAILAVLIAWWAYRTFIWEPGPLPAPASATVGVPALPESWPLAHGDLGGTRATSAPARVQAEPAWTADLGSPPSSLPVADTQRVLVALQDGRLVSLSPQDGAVQWELRYSNPLWASPTLAGDLVVVTERTGRISALEAATGEERWRAQTLTVVATPALVADGVVYVYGQAGLFAFEAETGQRLWDVEIGTQWAFAAPALSEDYVALVTGNRLYFYDRETGEQTYFYEFERAHPFTVNIEGGTAYAASSRFAGAFELDSRRPWWEGWRAVWAQFAIWGMAPIPPPPPSLWTSRRPPEGFTAALGPDSLFVASPEGDVIALGRDDGTERWRTHLGELVAPPTLTADGLLLVEHDRLVLLDPSTGAEVTTRAGDGERLTAALVTADTTYLSTNSRLLALR